VAGLHLNLGEAASSCDMDGTFQQAGGVRQNTKTGDLGQAASAEEGSAGAPGHDGRWMPSLHPRAGEPSARRRSRRRTKKTHKDTDNFLSRWRWSG
jgi:hypothetical protein